MTSHYRSHRTDRMERETVDVETFIGRMVQQTVPKGFGSDIHVMLTLSRCFR